MKRSDTIVITSKCNVNVCRYCSAAVVYSAYSEWTYLQKLHGNVGTPVFWQQPADYTSDVHTKYRQNHY